MTKKQMLLPAAAAAGTAAAVLGFRAALRFPELRGAPQYGKWYRITPKGTCSSDGSPWHGMFKLGRENKVLLYFYGGGASVDAYTAATPSCFYTDRADPLDWNQARQFHRGILSAHPANPFRDWTVIAVPYTTGDLHVGAGEFVYAGRRGRRCVLHHNGYRNYRALMDAAVPLVPNPQAVLVSGFSAGAFGAAFLARDVFDKDYPRARDKAVLMDSPLLRLREWQNLARAVWHTPDPVLRDVSATDNAVLDALRALRRAHGDVRILLDCSIRDEVLILYQNYLDRGVQIPGGEESAAAFEAFLKETAEAVVRELGGCVYLWTDRKNPKDRSLHTVISRTLFYRKRFDGSHTAASWAAEAVSGTLRSYGLDLL